MDRMGQKPAGISSYDAGLTAVGEVTSPQVWWVLYYTLDMWISCYVNSLTCKAVIVVGRMVHWDTGR